MDDDSLSGFVAIAALIALHAAVTLMHAALVNVRLSTIRDEAGDGNPRAKQVIALVASPQLTITYALLIIIIRFVIAGVAVIQVADSILEAEATLNSGAVYGITLVLVACITLILGDLVPEAVGSTYARSLIYFVAPVMQWFVFLLRPVVIVVLKSSQLLSSIFKSSQLVNTVTEEEIMSMIDAGHTGGSIEEEEKDMIYSVLQLDQTRVSEVMVPRIDIVAIEINEDIEAAGQKFVSSGYSRIPVYEESIDNIRGILYAKDLLAHWTRSDNDDKSITEMMRPVYFVPETKRADEMLKEIQLQKVHLAIVVDEYGGTAGLVTIENIIEEIIGDIQDEYDINEEAEYEEISSDEYYVDASIDLDDFNDLLDVDLPTEDSDTLGGHIYTYFGRVPLVGETIEEDELTMTVLSVDGRRIRKVHIIRKREDDSEDATNSDEREAVNSAPDATEEEKPGES